MGWRGSETEIPVGMVFRKMFCHKCGCRLKKEKITKTYKQGDPEYSDKILGHSTLGMSEISKSYYIYRCSGCGAEMELKKDMTIIMVTHNMQQAFLIADYTAYFLLGEMIEMDETKKFFSSPVDKRTDDYINGRFG